MRPRLSPAFALLLAAGLAAAGAPSGCAEELPCQFNSDCLVGYCVNGACKKDCVDASRDCPPGFSCDENAQCVPGSTGPSGSGGSGGASSSVGPGGASSTSASTTSSGPGPTSSSASTSSSSGGTGNKHELDLCASDAECASTLVCRAMVPGGAKRCTRSCTSNAGCWAGTRCVPQGSGQFCLGEDTGRPCTAASSCNFGCLTGQQYCTTTCNTGSDCPNGYGCMPVNGVSICIKAEAPCSSADASACIAPAACDESVQMVVGGCTLTCNSAADCPQRAAGFTPWSCDAGGICRRPPDVFGPLENGATPAQWACNALGQVVNVCNDAQHIDFGAFTIPGPPSVSCSATVTTDGLPGDSCVDSCRYQGGCPFGFACTGVGNLNGARIGLCLPEGGGEVGAPCAHDSQCAFGYCPSSGKCSRDCTFDGVCPSGSSCAAAGGPPVEGAPFRRCQ